jgi:acyl-CoA thioester hydrolase
MLSEHTITIRVRYCETDAMGFLHHSHYISYFESGRTELLRAQGGNYRKMEELGLFFVVADVAVKYRQPARYDDLLTLRTIIEQMGPVKLKHRYEMTRDGVLIAEGTSTLACLNRDGAVQRIPENLAEMTAG